MVSIDCRTIFSKAHVLAHISYASTVWSSASEVDIKTPNSLYTDEELHKFYLTIPYKRGQN